VPPSSSTPAASADTRSPDVHYGHPHTSIKLDQVLPDARYGVPEVTTPAVVAVPRTEVVEADAGFDWGDAIIGGGGALILTAALGGAGLAIRPRRASASG
jgi:hypothetical protein